MTGHIKLCLLVLSFILAHVSFVVTLKSRRADDTYLSQKSGSDPKFEANTRTGYGNVFDENGEPPSKSSAQHYPSPWSPRHTGAKKGILSERISEYGSEDHQRMDTSSKKKTFKGTLNSSPSRVEKRTLSKSDESAHEHENNHFAKHHTKKHSKSHHKGRHKSHHKRKHTHNDINERRHKHAHKSDNSRDNREEIYNSSQHTPQHYSDHIPVQPEPQTMPPGTRTKSTDKTTCSTCASNPLLDEEVVKQLRVEMFIKTLAQKLRVTPEELKSGRREKPPPKLPLEVFEQRDAPESDMFYSREEKRFLTGHDMGKNCIHERITGCYKFVFDGMANWDVSSAKLWLYKNPDRNDDGGQTFLLYGLTKRRNRAVSKESLIQRHESNVRQGWIEIDVSRWMDSGSRRGKDHQMIGIRCETCAHRSHRALFGAKQHYKPLLVFKRRKRTSFHHSRHERDSDDYCDATISCCKKPLTINFTALNFTNIISPSVLNVNYCHGVCHRSNIPQQAYNHTIFKNHVLASASANTSTLEELTVCCVPIEFTGHSFWMANNVQKAIPNLIARTCGCA